MLKRGLRVTFATVSPAKVAQTPILEDQGPIKVKRVGATAFRSACFLEGEMVSTAPENALVSR
jgi:hypothetical protein